MLSVAYKAAKEADPNIKLISGGITRDLSVVASYTNQKLRDPYGRRRRNIPDNMANLLLDYHRSTGALKGSDVFVGATHTGDYAGETVTNFTALGVPEQPGFYIPAHTIVNAGAGYKIGRYKYNLNVNNALNTHTWWMGQARSSLAPYPGINFIFSVKVHL